MPKLTLLHLFRGCIKLGAVTALHMLNCVGPHYAVIITEKAKCHRQYHSCQSDRVDPQTGLRFYSSLGGHASLYFSMSTSVTTLYILVF